MAENNTVTFGHTERGFTFIEFTDRGNHKCTLQKSSLATEHAIWFGANEIGLKKFTPGKGWEHIQTKDNEDWFNGVTYIANNRMHLTQDQVAILLPYLIRFAETGELIREV